MKKFYFIYKITLLKGSLAGHYYFGQHSTYNINDGYAGSGRIITDYYKKYGKINHQTYIKEIISFHNSPEELNDAEYAIIGTRYEDDPLCLNLQSGGNHHTAGKEAKHKMSESKKGRKTWITGKHHSQITKDRLSKYSPWTKGKPSTIKGKHRVYREDGSFYFE